MPYLNIEMNHSVDEAVRNSMLSKLSVLIAAQLDKSESYVMVSFASPRPMLFAATNYPCAYLSLKSIRLSSAKTPALSAALCQLVEEELGIPKARIYIEFADAARSMWGWNEKTF